jgi:hypothetical protein
VRSLRLPKMSSLLKSIYRHGWIERLSTRLLELFKSARARRLAV